MKQDTINHNVIGDLGGEKTAFTLDAQDAVLMQRLSDQTYSYPIRAIIRELSTNAYDSHLDANQTKPFEVFLPTFDEQIFFVKDHGTGLSRKKLEEIYTQYGNSTKRDNEEAVGAIGIGSKSPFAYTTMFSIESVCDGTKIIASCAKTEKGIPELSILSESKTTESNGFKVQFAVKSLDISKFKQEALNIFQWFDKKPKCNLELDYKSCQAHNVKSDHGYYKILNSKRHTDPACVVMGNICYPIDKNEVKVNCPGLVIIAPMGKVNFATSRESLHYTSKTCSYLASTFAKIKKDYTQSLQSQCDNASNYFEARKVLLTANPFLVDKLNYNGKEIEESVPISNYSCQQISNYHAPDYVYSIPLRCTDPQFLKADIKQGKLIGAKNYLASKNMQTVILIEKGAKFEQDFGIKLESVSKYYQKQKTAKKAGQILKLSDQISYYTSKKDSWTITQDHSTHSGPLVYIELKNYKPVDFTISDLTKIRNDLGLSEIFGCNSKTSLKTIKKLPQAISLKNYLGTIKSFPPGWEAKFMEDGYHGRSSSEREVSNFMAHHYHDPSKFSYEKAEYQKLMEKIDKYSCYSNNVFLNRIDSYLDITIINSLKRKAEKIVDSVYAYSTPKIKIMSQYLIFEVQHQKELEL